MNVTVGSFLKVNRRRSTLLENWRVHDIQKKCLSLFGVSIWVGRIVATTFVAFSHFQQRNAEPLFSLAGPIKEHRRTTCLYPHFAHLLTADNAAPIVAHHRVVAAAAAAVGVPGVNADADRLPVERCADGGADLPVDACLGARLGGRAGVGRPHLRRQWHRDSGLGRSVVGRHRPQCWRRLWPHGRRRAAAPRLLRR